MVHHRFCDHAQTQQSLICHVVLGIVGIQTTYGDGRTSDLHGSVEDGSESYEFTLGQHEKIVSAEVRCGLLLDALTFKTNDGRNLGQFGGTGGAAYLVNPPNETFLANLEGTVDEIQGHKTVRNLKLVWE